MSGVGWCAVIAIVIESTRHMLMNVRNFSVNPPACLSTYNTQNTVKETVLLSFLQHLNTSSIANQVQWALHFIQIKVYGAFQFD